MKLMIRIPQIFFSGPRRVFKAFAQNSTSIKAFTNASILNSKCPEKRLSKIANNATELPDRN